MEIQRYQRLIPVGRLMAQNQVYFLLQPDPVQSERRWVDQLGCWEFMVVPAEPLTDEHEQVIKSGHNPVYPSPRLVVVTDFLIEWGNDGFEHILALPTEEYEVVNV